MPQIPPDDYAQRRTAQINAAIDVGNCEMVVGILRLIADDGYPGYADVIRDHLIEQGLNLLVVEACGRAA